MKFKTTGMENNKPLMVGQSGSCGCCRRVMAKAAWILTLGNLSVTRTSMAWWMRSKRSSSIWAFSAILPSNLLISWHTRKRTAWLLALWDWKDRKVEMQQPKEFGRSSEHEGKRHWIRKKEEDNAVRRVNMDWNRERSTRREGRQMGEDKIRLRRSRDISHFRYTVYSKWKKSKIECRKIIVVNRGLKNKVNDKHLLQM